MALDFIKKFLKKHYIAYLFGIAMMLVSTYSRMQYPKFLGQAIDVLRASTVDQASLKHLIFWIVAVSIISFASMFLGRQYLIGQARVLDKELREALFVKYQNLSQRFYNEHKTGDLIAYAINDINAVRMTLGVVFAMTLNGLVTLVVALYQMVANLDPVITIASMLPMPLVLILMSHYGRSIRERFRVVQANFGRISDRVNENISGIRVIKAYVQEEEELKRFDDLSQEMADSNMSMVRVTSLMNPTVQVGFAMSFAIFLVLGGQRVLDGSVSIGSFVAFNGYLALMLMPITSVARIINIIQRGMASIDRLNVVLEEPIDVVDGTGAAGEMKTAAIRLNHLSFRYPKATQDSLSDVSLELQAGQTLGVLGATGSGKTTLVNLLLKVYKVPDRKIYLGGEDINDYTLDALRQSIGYVPQDNFLFGASVYDNVTFFMDKYTEDDVIEALKAAEIYDSIMSLPQGLQTMLGERGVNLSGGQKQRISIARALIRKPKLLILDDALSAVDTETEEAILQNLRQYRENSTTIIIAHRISAVKDADQIVVFDDGKITERGTHDALLEKGGAYREIYEVQHK